MKRLIGKLYLNCNEFKKLRLIFTNKDSIPIKNGGNESILGELLSDKNSKSEADQLIILFQGNLFGLSSEKEAENYILSCYKSDKTFNFIQKLNGSFNLILYDLSIQKVFIVTDKYGSRPLFVYSDTKQFLFASEVKYMLDLLDFVPAINWVGWGQYLTFRFTLGSNTFFKGIELIDPGTLFMINLHDSTVIKMKYWSYTNIKYGSIASFEDKIAEGKNVFKTVFSSLGNDIASKKTLLALSGGYDSRSIAAGIHKFVPKSKFDTVTTLHPCGSELEIVHELARSLDITNKYIERPKDIYRKHFIKRAFTSDGLVQEHLWALPLKNTIKKYEVHIDGIAGDIIMRSTRVRPIHAKKYMDLNYLAKLFKKQFGFEYTWLKNYIDPEIWEELRYSEYWAVEQLQKLPDNENRMTYFLMNNRIRNGISIAPNNILGRIVPEVVQPFFDDRIAFFGLSLPLEFKFSFIYRKIIDATYPEIKHIRSTSDEDLDKLKSYDAKIEMFDDNPRELVNDFLNMSEDDEKYLLELLNTLDKPPFLNVAKFIKDEGSSPKMNRVNTVVDIMLWYHLFISRKINK